MKSSFSTPSLVGREKADSEKLSAGGWLQAAQTLNLPGAKGSPGSQSASFQKIRIGRHDQSLPLMGRTNTTARMKGKFGESQQHQQQQPMVSGSGNFQPLGMGPPLSDIREWRNVLRWRERQQQNLQRQLVHLADKYNSLLDLYITSQGQAKEEAKKLKDQLSKHKHKSKVAQRFQEKKERTVEELQVLLDKQSKQHKRDKTEHEAEVKRLNTMVEELSEEINAMKKSHRLNMHRLIESRSDQALSSWTTSPVQHQPKRRRRRRRARAKSDSFDAGANLEILDDFDGELDEEGVDEGRDQEEQQDEQDDDDDDDDDDNDDDDDDGGGGGNGDDDDDNDDDDDDDGKGDGGDNDDGEEEHVEGNRGGGAECLGEDDSGSNRSTIGRRNRSRKQKPGANADCAEKKRVGSSSSAIKKLHLKIELLECELESKRQQVFELRNFVVARTQENNH